MGPEIRNPLNRSDRLTNSLQGSKKLTFTFILDETNDADTVSLCQYPDIVVHPNASAVHLQDRRISGQHEDVHYSLVLRMSAAMRMVSSV